MKKLWVKISFAFIISFMISSTTAILLSFIPFSNEDEDLQFEDVIYFYELLEQGIIDGRLEETKEEILQQAEDEITRAVDYLENQGFREGFRPEEAAFESLKELLIYAVTPIAIIVLLSSSFVGIIMGLILSKSISAPLKDLVNATKMVGNKELKSNLKIDGAEEFQQLALSFNRMVDELKDSENQNKMLTADIAHELRTPLTVLEGNLRASLDNIKPLNEENIASLYNQTSHLISLVKDLRELAMAESNQLPLKFKEIDILEIIRETASIFEFSIIDLSLKLELILPELKFLTIVADELRIRQVLHNLIQNAVSFSKPEGFIRIRVIDLDERIVIEVSDNGLGIEDDQVKNIFNRLYKVDSSRSRGKGGSGLGLAIVKAITENHNGTIDVFSKGLNMGSTFTLTLPKIQVSRMESE